MCDERQKRRFWYIDKQEACQSLTSLKPALFHRFFVASSHSGQTPEEKCLKIRQPARSLSKTDLSWKTNRITRKTHWVRPCGIDGNGKVDLKSKNSIFAQQPTTVFTVMSGLATHYQAINLGQGFPDQDGPSDMREAAARYAIDGPNQYPPTFGMPALRQAVADHDKRFYGLDLNWETEVLVTSGATEALAACIMGLVNPG